MELKELTLVSQTDRSTQYSLQHHCYQPCHKRGSEGITVASSSLKTCDLRKLWLKLKCRLEVAENFSACPPASFLSAWFMTVVWTLIFLISWMCEHNCHLPGIVPANTQRPLWLPIGWTIRQCEEGSFWTLVQQTHQSAPKLWASVLR